MDRTTAVACLIALLGAGCARSPKVVVGSKNFTEQVILGEIVAQQVERRLKIPVERRLNLGGTLLAHEALVSGSIDVYPEYTGTALTAVLKSAPSSDPAAVLETVRREYEARWKLAWLAPLGFNNTFAMVVRRDTAGALGLRTLSEAARRQQPWTLGAGYEFQQRADGLAGLLKTYGLRLSGPPLAMDLGLLYSALESRKVDLIAANSTDGLLSALDVTTLADDRRYFPPYECALVARDEALKNQTGLRAALDELSNAISDREMQRLNYAVDGQHRPVSEVAREWLARLPARR